MVKHKVTKTECIEAIRYFHEAGFIDELTSDKRYYVKILLKQVANKYFINLEGIDNEDF